MPPIYLGSGLAKLCFGAQVVNAVYVGSTLAYTANTTPVAPTNITLSASIVSESASVGTVVGTLSANGYPSSAYTEILDASGKFSVVGNELRIAAALDYETATSHSVTVRATNIAGSYDKIFSVSVTNTTELPVNTATPSISGAPTQGGTLTGADGTWASAAGAISYARQWLRDGVAISGATSGSYVLDAADVGSAISYRVTSTNSDGSTQATSVPVGPVVAPTLFSATGGTFVDTVIDGTTYRIHTFISSGAFVVSGSGIVDYLVVGGGGAGGSTTLRSGGGGGAGDVIAGSLAVTDGTYNVVVGSGGNAVTSANGAPGAASSFGAISAPGGGGGAGSIGSPLVGSAGASGGGGGGDADNNQIDYGGSATGAGNAGGAGYGSGTSADHQAAGGGGGASTPGVAAAQSTPGAGGAGVSNSITGTPTYYGGGGGGGKRTSVGGSGAAGGTGGGGAGGTAGAGAAGTNGTGGGGGGAGATALGGKGGNGIVIVRYPLA